MLRKRYYEVKKITEIMRLVKAICKVLGLSESGTIQKPQIKELELEQLPVKSKVRLDELLNILLLTRDTRQRRKYEIEFLEEIMPYVLLSNYDARVYLAKFRIYLSLVYGNHGSYPNTEVNLVEVAPHPEEQIYS